MLLQQRELLGMGEQLASELGKPFADERVEGRLTCRVDLVNGRYTLA